MSSLLNLKIGTADNSDFKQVFDVASADGAITIPTREIAIVSRSDFQIE